MKVIKVKFKTEEDAKDFVVAFASSGGDAQINESVDGDNKSVSIVSSSSRTLSFVRGVAKDILESAKCKAYADSLRNAISETIMCGHPISFVLMNGKSITLNKTNAQLLANVHDRLDESRQTSFLVFACESESAYEHALGFALIQTKGN